ncbi:MAG TPA: methyltransferase domain-containing protein [Ignavibacteriaceae bacterium]|nr:methyltransferase domain-containing protein [Ignavibacteriaceae bacterium]
MELLDKVVNALKCPKCLSDIEKRENLLVCTNDNCKVSFPIINGRPVLINEENSVFKIADFVEMRDTTRNTNKSFLRKKIRSLIPSISKNIGAKENYNRFLEKLLSLNNSPKVLILGSGIKGEGIEVLFNNRSIELYESDVSFGPRTQYILDAHNIPFANEYFDGVIVQAVLEHVVDPFRCVQEIHRVLKKDGFVYAETPFIQQVHEGKYDFHRFTHLGHRRLFRNFLEIQSGAICGPGMALAWAYSYFIYCFFSSKKMRRLLLPFVHFSSFFLKYFDYFLINKPGVYDAASGYFFLGQKSDVVLTDIELLKLYKGLI